MQKLEKKEKKKEQENQRRINDLPFMIKQDVLK